MEPNAMPRIDIPVLFPVKGGIVRPGSGYIQGHPGLDITPPKRGELTCPHELYHYYVSLDGLLESSGGPQGEHPAPRGRVAADAGGRWPKGATKCWRAHVGRAAWKAALRGGRRAAREAGGRADGPSRLA